MSTSAAASSAVPVETNLTPAPTQGLPTVRQAIAAATANSIGRAHVPPVGRESVVAAVDTEAGRTAREIGKLRDRLRCDKRLYRLKDEVKRFEEALANLRAWRERNGDGLPPKEGN